MEPDFQLIHFAPNIDPFRIFKAFKRFSWISWCSALLFIHFELYKKSHSGQRVTKNVFMWCNTCNSAAPRRGWNKDLDCTVTCLNSVTVLHCHKQTLLYDLPLFWSTGLWSSLSILRWILEFSCLGIRFGVLCHNFKIINSPIGIYILFWIVSWGVLVAWEFFYSYW